MFPNKSGDTPRQTVVSIFRVVHGLLIFHAAAIVGITFFVDVSGTFALAVAIPIALGSCSFLLATTARVLFVPGIFFCAFLALTLACLPIMMNVFLPVHLAVCGLAALYGISCIILVHFFFAQPVPKKR